MSDDHDPINLTPEASIKTNFPVMRWLVVGGFAVGTWATFVSINLSRVVDELAGLRRDMQEIPSMDKRVARTEFEIAGIKEELTRLRK